MTRLPALAIAIVVGLLLALRAPLAAAQAPDAPRVASDRSVKAAYIYRFLPYIEWPEHAAPTGALVVGVIAADDVAQELEQIVRSRPADGRPIVVRRLGLTDMWLGTHVLFISQDALGRAQQVMNALQDHAVLTISDADGAVGRGVVIGFVTVDSKLRFEVNAAAAERSSLKLSSRLLTVALRVRTGER